MFSLSYEEKRCFRPSYKRTPQTQICPRNQTRRASHRSFDPPNLKHRKIGGTQPALSSSGEMVVHKEVFWQILPTRHFCQETYQLVPPTDYLEYKAEPLSTVPPLLLPSSPNQAIQQELQVQSPASGSSQHDNEPTARGLPIPGQN